MPFRFKSFLFRAALIGIVAFSWPAASCLAGQSPENIAVVVNADSPVSLWIANEYIALRQIPPACVIYLEGVTARDRLAVSEWREQVLQPVLRALDERKLGGQIDGIVYSADLPWEVALTGKVSVVRRSIMNNDKASATGLTYLYMPVLSQISACVNPGINAYFRQIATAAKDAKLTEPEQKEMTEVMAPLAQFFQFPEPPATNTAALENRAAILKDLAEKARPVLEKIVAAHPAASDVQYYLAGVLASCGQTNAAMTALKAALDAGWMNPAEVKGSRLHAPLRNLPEFNRLLTEQIAPAPPSVGFRGSLGWSPSDGQPVAPNAGRRYLLCTMLAVTTKFGNTPEEAIESLRRAAAADRTRPAGTIFYMRNGDVRSTTRAHLFASAVKALRDLGVSAEIRDGVLPEKCDNVAGVMAGMSDFAWTNSHSRIMGGAICEHFTSCGGEMASGFQTKLTEWLRHGAAGSCGTVSEPYALDFKFPNAFLQVHYARGCTLAEAFYQSVASPYQLLIVGDPLCQPWAVETPFKVEGIKDGATFTSNTVLVARAPTGTVAAVEYYCDGRRVGFALPGKAFALPVMELADGVHDLAVVAVSATPLETRTRKGYAFRVNRTGHQVALTTSAAGVTPHAGTIEFTVRAAGADRLELTQNNRLLAEGAGPEGTFKVPAAKLGPGPVRVLASARYGKETNSASAVSAPLSLTVAPPVPGT